MSLERNCSKHNYWYQHNDTECRACEVARTTGLDIDDIVIYAGQMYRGSVIRCRVEQNFDPEHFSRSRNGLNDRGISLQLDPGFSNHTYIWTKEPVGCCGDCGERMINEGDYLCGLCRGEKWNMSQSARLA